MMPCEYVWTPVFYIAVWLLSASFDLSYRFYTHPLKMKIEFFLFRTRFFQTLVTLPLPRGVGFLYCYRSYSHHRTEPPFFSLVIYTELLLMSPSNNICYFSSFSLFPLHLTCCCLYGAFRKQTICSVIIGITSDLRPVQGPDVMLCIILLSLSLLQQICFYSCEL